jgi:prophage antirepressor-like protein
MQMTFEESVPVQDEPESCTDNSSGQVRNETESAVEPVVEDAVVENANPVAVSVFNFESHNVRTVVAENGEVWFVAKDVADALGYSDTYAMTRRLDKDESMTAKLAGMNMNSVFINESGLFSSILGSQKPEAKRFKKWVTSEVLPAIRKTGKYEAPKVEPKQDGSLLEKIKTTGEIVNATMSLLQSLGIEGNQAALGANKVASQETGINILELNEST